MKHILLIEDEPHMQRGLKDNLEYEGYEVEVVGDGLEGLERMKASAHDLVILDVMLPRLSGFDVCKQARAAGVKTYVIMLTAKGEEVDRVLGLELGADDYVTKPFSLRELLARVKAVLRRQRAALPAGEAHAGQLVIDFASYHAECGDEDVEMTHREFEVLRYLYERPLQTVSRDQLLADVWGYESQPTTRTVDNFILKLRQKVEADPRHPRHILTVHGVGYKFVP